MSRKDKIRDQKENIPVANYDKGLGCFQWNDGTYADIYQITAKDLVNGDPDEIEMDCFTWAKFYKTYGMDVEIISMMFPCDTSRQQTYFQELLDKNENPDFDAMIRRKISELEYRDRHTVRKEFFLLCFWKTREEIRNGRKTLESTLGLRGLESDGNGGLIELLSEISLKKKSQVLFKFANKNSQIF